MKQFQGIFPALVTPFTPEGKFSDKAMEKLVQHNLAKGVAGFYVGGSTGESFLLTPDERKYALEVVMQTVQGRADVIANIGAFSTEQGADLARHASRLGVAAISSVPPFYFKFSIDEYYAYYCDLINEAGVPMIIYNVPALSGVVFSNADLARFLANDRIIGLKHTSYDLFQMQQILADFPAKSIFIGHDEIYLSALAAGARAAIGSTFNFMAEKFIEIGRCLGQGDLGRAQALQAEVNRIVAVLVKIGVFKGIKAALALQGLPCGECRKPFQPLAAEELALLREVLEHSGLIG